MYMHINNLYKGKMRTLVFTKIVNLFSSVQRFLVFVVIPFFFSLKRCNLFLGNARYARYQLIAVAHCEIWCLNIVLWEKAYELDFTHHHHHHLTMSRCPVIIRILLEKTVIYSILTLTSVLRCWLTANPHQDVFDRICTPRFIFLNLKE